MQKKYALLLATVVGIFSTNAYASMTPELFSLIERTEDPRKITNAEMRAKLEEEGPIADPRIIAFLKETPVSVVSPNQETLQLKAIGAEEFDVCVALKTDPSLAGGIGPKNIQEANGETFLLSGDNGARWLQDHFAPSSNQSYLKRSYLYLMAGEYVAHLRLSTNHFMKSDEELTSQDPLQSWSFCIEAMTTDIGHRQKGYARALLIMTASMIQKMAHAVGAKASIHAMINSDDEIQIKTLRTVGFEMKELVHLNRFFHPEDTSHPIHPIQLLNDSDAKINLFEYQIRAEIDLSTYDAAHYMQKISAQF